MNAFDDACRVELRSMTVLTPFLRGKAKDGQFVVASKGKLAPYLQEAVGDALFNAKSGDIWSVEIKAEERYTGNLFLETWSNRNLEDAASHTVRGSNPGWLYKSRAELLFYHFLDSDRLYVISMYRLRRWAFSAPGRHMSETVNNERRRLPGRLFDFPEIEQSKRQQMNDTRGRLVPIKVLREEAGVGAPLHPKQMAMAFADDEVVA